MSSNLRSPASTIRRGAIAATLLLALPTVIHAAEDTSPTWEPCADARFECASIGVPWDPADPESGSLQIPLVRHPASGSERVGVLLFSPGGPGIAGTETLMTAIDVFPAVVQERFDIVSFDPRGTGGAAAIACGTDVAALFAVDPASDADASGAAWAARAEACAESLGEHLGAYSTGAAVHDVELIREALGEEQVSWLVTSYGTRLATEHQRRYPERVRVLVLDGAMDPSAPLGDQARDMAGTSDAAVARMLAACYWQDPCPLGEDPTGAYDALARSLRDQPLTTPEGTTAGIATLQNAAHNASALPVFFGQPFVEAVVAAQGGDGSGLVALGPGPSEGSTFDAQWVILCNDESERLEPDQAAELASELDAIAPRTGLGVALSWGLGCQASPAATSPIEALAADASAPVLVIGSSGDPSTSYAWSERLAAALPGARLLTREGEGHTAFWNTFYMGCTGNAVSEFLIDPAGAAPPASCAD